MVEIPPVEPLYGLAAFALLVALVALLIVALNSARKIPVKVEEGKTVYGRVAGGGWVLEKNEDSFTLHRVKITDDGWAVAPNSKKSWLVRGVKPYYVIAKRFVFKRIIPMWIVDTQGNIMRMQDKGELNPQTLPPELSYAVINSKLLDKAGRTLGGDPLTLFYGVMLGLGVMAIILFIVAPALGIPIQIGQKPVEISVEIPRQVGQLPPPGNFTVGG